MCRCLVLGSIVLAALALGNAAESRPRAIAPPPPPPPVADAAKPSVHQPNPLVWDATEKTHRAKPGEQAADYIFVVTNSGAEQVTIAKVAPACGCTIATLPNDPWVLAPGATSSFGARLDFAGKQGVVSKTLEVESSGGLQTLRITVEIPISDPAFRRHNQELARHDRQLVFQGECAACHVTPVKNAKGAELFVGACGICHTAPARADVVPDLRIARERRDAEFWRNWIVDGKPGTMMPAFGADRGGPLTHEQVDSLVGYLLANFPRDPQVVPVPGVPLPTTGPSTGN